MKPSSLVVIGAGPGGFAAALEAASRGLTVTLIDEAAIGGTCLNRGCIPSKFFLAQAKTATGTPDLTTLQGQKDKLLATLRQRMDQAVKAAKITWIQGWARWTTPHDVEVSSNGTTQTLQADAFILATGSAPVALGTFPDHPAVLNSTTLLSLDYLPTHLLVVGGGYIGCELACAFQGFGSKVTLIEKEPTLLAAQPEWAPAASVLQRSLEKRGMTVWTNTKAAAVQALDRQTLAVELTNGEKIDVNAALIALGRRPDFSNLGLDKAGLSPVNGRLSVSPHMQTGVPHIYAIGDAVSPLPLAHAAAKEGEVAVRHLLGDSVEPVDYRSIPRCIYTWPEVAAVGLTLEEAQAQGFSARADRFHFAGSAKAMADGDAEGFWLVISDTLSKKILGATIIGPQATELIHLVALCIKGGLTTETVADMVFAHPSLSEGLHEAMKRSLATRPARQAS